VVISKEGRLMLKRAIRFILLPALLVSLLVFDEWYKTIKESIETCRSVETSFVIDQEPIFHGRHAAYWIEQLKDDDAETQKHAAGCLIQISHFHGAAEALLQQAIDDTDDDALRARATRLLEMIREPGDGPG
jgi:hypothetical protein